MCIPLKCAECEYCEKTYCTHPEGETSIYLSVNPEERHIKCPIVKKMLDYRGERKGDVVLYNKYRESTPTTTTDSEDDEQWIYQEICSELSDTDEVTIFSPIYEPCP